MSRCFPFPPPGYEKKTRSDDVDLLIKDKKDKKHKKEKRDKKKEGKDKDGERTKDKDGEKKDRKEKHKDKKKSKSKEKKDEKKIGGQPEGPNGGKHSENHQQAEAVKDTKFMEIGRRIADEERGRRDQMVENLPCRDQMVENLPCQMVENLSRQDQMVENLPRRDQMLENLPRRDQMLENLPRRDQMVENLSRRDQMVENLPRLDSRKEDIVDRLVEKYFDSGFQEREKVKDKDGHDKRTDRKALKNEGRVMENTVLPSFTGAEQRRVGGTARPMENKGGQALRDEGRVMENTAVPSFTAADQRKVGVAARPMDTKDGRDKKADRHTVKDEGRVTENIMVPSFSGAEQRRVGSTDRLEKETEKKMEGKEKNKDLAGSDKQVGKHTRKDGEKKNKHKKAAEKKMKEKIKHENRKQDMMVEIPKDHINTLIKPIQISKDTEKSGNAEENLRKRKDCETNGFLHEHDVRPNKLLRPTLSPHLLTLNGRKAEPCQPATPLASAMPRGPSNIRFDNKILAVNGLIQAQPTSINSTSPSIPPVQARENSGASKKSPPPPHPDSKYLSQILTVPKLDDWSGFDDQEWLFSSDSLQEKKPKAVYSGVDGSQQVWDRALRIDSADVCALPYVIPY